MSTNQENTLHPDWASDDDASPAGDLAEALEYVGRKLDEVAAVERYAVSYHGAEWHPGDDTGSELDMTVVARLHSGEWLAVEAGNDYTGWGCQDFSDVHVGADEDDAVYNGLSKEARGRLGYPERV